MEKIPIDEFQKNFDTYVKKVETGESFVIENSEGRSVIMLPAEDEIIKIHTDWNNDAS